MKIVARILGLIAFTTFVTPSAYALQVCHLKLKPGFPPKFERVCKDVAACAIIYRHGGFGGAAWLLYDNAAAADLTGAMAERRTWHGHLHGWRGSDVSWDNLASSARVSAGCTLTGYDRANYTGAEWQYQATAGGEKAFDQLSPGDAISSFKCSCTGKPLADSDWLINPLP